jgi:hypothetical protein
MLAVVDVSLSAWNRVRRTIMNWPSCISRRLRPMERNRWVTIFVLIWATRRKGIVALRF